MRAGRSTAVGLDGRTEEEGRESGMERKEGKAQVVAISICQQLPLYVPFLPCLSLLQYNEFRFHPFHQLESSN